MHTVVINAQSSNSSGAWSRHSSSPPRPLHAASLACLNCAPPSSCKFRRHGLERHRWEAPESHGYTLPVVVNTDRLFCSPLPFAALLCSPIRSPPLPRTSLMFSEADSTEGYDEGTKRMYGLYAGSGVAGGGGGMTARTVREREGAY